MRIEHHDANIMNFEEEILYLKRDFLEYLCTEADCVRRNVADVDSDILAEKLL